MIDERPPARDIAAAKLNLALHVRGRRGDGRHSIETIFAFCTNGDRLSAQPASDLSLTISGPFTEELGEKQDNLVMKAAVALRELAGVRDGAALTLEKNLPVASGLGGGSADAAAALRLLTALWGTDPDLATRIGPALGSDVPACLLSFPVRGEGAGDALSPVDLDLSGTPVLLVNPRIAVPTSEVFARWDGEDRGPLQDWRVGRNDLETAAITIAPQIETVLAWLGTQPGAEFVRMSGSGATCFALFADEESCAAAAERVPREWWRMVTSLR